MVGYICLERKSSIAQLASSQVWDGGHIQSLVLDAKVLNSLGCFQALFGLFLFLVSNCASSGLLILCLSLEHQVHNLFFSLLSSLVVFLLKNILVVIWHGPVLDIICLTLSFWKWLCRMTVIAMFLYLWVPCLQVFGYLIGVSRGAGGWRVLGREWVYLQKTQPTTLQLERCVRKGSGK